MTPSTPSTGQDRAAPLTPDALAARIKGLPFVRMTGGDMDIHGLAGTLAEECDWDEYMDLIDRATVLRLLAELDRRSGADARLREALVRTLRAYHMVAFDYGHNHPVEQCDQPMVKERLALAASPQAPEPGTERER